MNHSYHPASARRTLLLSLLAAVCLAPGLFAGNSKIAGRITDGKSGEALVGANVVVMGTSMGAATNTVGEYTILNVEPGTYTLRATYISYQTITVSNVRVNADLTTSQDFSLPAEGVQVATVEIVAERPLVKSSSISRDKTRRGRSQNVIKRSNSALVNVTRTPFRSCN